MNILTCCSNSWVGKEATELCKCWHECLMPYEQQRHIPRLLWHFLLPGARWDVLNAKKKTQKWTWCLEVAMFFLFCFVFIELTSFSAPQQEHMGGKRSGWINYGLPDSSCSHWSGTMIRSRRPIAQSTSAGLSRVSRHHLETGSWVGVRQLATEEGRLRIVAVGRWLKWLASAKCDSWGVTFAFAASIIQGAQRLTKTYLRGQMKNEASVGFFCLFFLNQFFPWKIAQQRRPSSVLIHKCAHSVTCVLRTARWD